LPKPELPPIVAGDREGVARRDLDGDLLELFLLKTRKGDTGDFARNVAGRNEVGRGIFLYFRLPMCRPGETVNEGVPSAASTVVKVPTRVPHTIMQRFGARPAPRKVLRQVVLDLDDGRVGDRRGAFGPLEEAERPSIGLSGPYELFPDDRLGRVRV
jgi:hypothetical protein